ncbi:MAG: hypothetical protein ACXAEX_03840 [Promethearchaeota archaeon]
MSYSERTALKEIIKFAKREFKEKKPLNIKVLRVKDKQIFSRGGTIPSIRVRQAQVPYYLVVVEYEHYHRIYKYFKSGILISAENYEKHSKEIKEYEKSTKLEFNIKRQH